MKRILAVSLVVATLIQSHAQEFGQTTSTTATAAATQPSAGSDARERFASGLLSEEGENDLAAAAAAYRQAIQEFDRQREGAANAIFRLGEVYRKMGALEEAKVQYARILREFPDMVRLTELSHNSLFGDESRSAGAASGGFGGGEGLGGGGTAGMPGTRSAIANTTEEGAGYVDKEMSERYGMTVLRMQRSGTKPQPEQAGAVSTSGDVAPKDAAYFEKLMMQRYGLVPGRVGGPTQEAGGRTVAEVVQDESKRIACVNNLKQLGLAARIYATDHGDVFPSTVGVMSNEVSVTQTLVCPADPSHSPAPSWGEFDPAAHLSYEYSGASAREDYPQTVLFRCPIHGHVGLADGSVQQGHSQQSTVTPQAVDMLRRRYGVGEMRLERSREVNGPTVTSITITREGTLMFDGEPLDVNQLTAKLKEQPEQLRSRTTVAIHTNEEVEFSRVMSVIEACQEAGVSSFTLRTK